MQLIYLEVLILNEYISKNYKICSFSTSFSIIVSILSLLFGFISSISEIFESSVSTKISTDYTGSQINSLEIDLKKLVFI